MARNAKIKAIQGNDNPFILDRTLVSRVTGLPTGPTAAPAGTGVTASRGPLEIRIVDVGAGLCCVAVTPDQHYMIFDAGNFKDRGVTAMTAIEELIPLGSTIDLLVLSHCDADHLAAVPFICENYKVAEIWRDGLERDTNIWQAANNAIAAEVTDDECKERNLQVDENELEPGYSITIGEATATFLCGFKDIPSDWLPLSPGEDRNARSIVARLDYGESSILFSGDTVGRHIGDPNDVCIAAEAFLVGNQATAPIDVDVVLAPHHGADNGSSTAFIQATSPRFVVFSSGSAHHHPHRRTAGRYLQAGVLQSQMFRTDLGDNEGAPEWLPSSGGGADPIGDDDVTIRMRKNGQITIEYKPAIDGLVLNPAGTQLRTAIAGASVLGRLSPQVRRWVEQADLWVDQHDHLEDHTAEKLPQSTVQSTVQNCVQYTVCQPRRFRFRGGRRCR